MKVFDILKQNPILLWGISLMAVLLNFLASAFGVLPIISLPITWVLSVGLTNIYLRACRGEKNFKTDDLFEGFYNKKIGRYAGGMGWMNLWIIIWGMIPVVGFVFAIIKTYAYMFVPYILIENPEVTPTEALRLSIKQTDGHKGKLFIYIALPGICLSVAFLVLFALTLIPFVGILFGLINFLLLLAVSALSPVFYGLLYACLYIERKNELEQ